MMKWFPPLKPSRADSLALHLGQQFHHLGTIEIDGSGPETSIIFILGPFKRGKRDREGRDEEEYKNNAVVHDSFCRSGHVNCPTPREIFNASFIKFISQAGRERGSTTSSYFFPLSTVRKLVFSSSPSAQDECRQTRYTQRERANCSLFPVQKAIEK